MEPNLYLLGKLYTSRIYGPSAFSLSTMTMKRHFHKYTAARKYIQPLYLLEKFT